MIAVHCTVVSLVVHPMFTIRERTFQAVIGRHPVSHLSRKVTMSVEKLFLVLTESLVRLSEHLLPSISGMLAVFHEAAIPIHQPSSVVKYDAKTILLPLYFSTRWDKQLIKSLGGFVI